MDMQTISPRAGRGAGSRVFSFSGRGGARGQGALSTSDVSAPEELAGAQQTLKRPALGVNCPHPLEQVLEVPGHIPAHQYLRHPPAAAAEPAQHAQFFAATVSRRNEESLRPMHSQQARWAAFCCLQLAWMPSCSAKVGQGFAPAPVPSCPLLFPFCVVCCFSMLPDSSYLCQVQTAVVMPHGDFVYAPDLVGFRNGSRELNAAAKVWRPRACQASPATRFYDERF